MSCGPCSTAKLVLFLYLRNNNSFPLNWKLICHSNDDFWLVGIYTTGVTGMIRMTTVNGLTVVIRMTRMAHKTGMQVWMTGMARMTRITGMTKTTRLTGMTGVTGMMRMTTVNGLTVITRKTRMAGKAGMQI